MSTPAAPEVPDTAARRLVGSELPGGWRVVELLERPPGHSGGQFSVSYRVVDGNGRYAFLKVLDYAAALQGEGDPATKLAAMTNAYLFEVNVLTMCGTRRLSRVVRALDSGATRAEGPNGEEQINFLVFEVADGDIRDAIDAADRIDDAWKLRMLHHAASGVRQLHGVGVAHQDLKPSNVLVFGGNESKIADLGCASLRGTPSPRDDLLVPGDFGYAPPELLYREVNPDWNARRLLCDLYHLGSLGVFLFTGQNMTSRLLSHLALEHRPFEWGDSYADVLPFVRTAFDEAYEEIARNCHEEIREGLVQRLRELTDPDPQLRGHPLNRRRHANRYSLERYVAAFDHLARKAEIGLNR